MSQGLCSSPFKSHAPVIKTETHTQTVQHFSDPMIEFLETLTLLERWMVIPIDIPIQIPIASPIGGGGCPIDIPIDIPIPLLMGVGRVDAVTLRPYSHPY